jgi:hypothetical protein
MRINRTKQGIMRRRERGRCPQAQRDTVAGVDRLGANRYPGWIKVIARRYDRTSGMIGQPA